MCNYFVDLNKISKKYKVSTSDIYKIVKFKEDLDDFISDGILNFKSGIIAINEKGNYLLETLL